MLEISDNIGRDFASWVKAKVVGVWNTSPLVFLILLGILGAVASFIAANSILFVELQEAFELWDTITMFGILAIYFVEGVAIIYIGGWLRNKTRGRR